MTPSETLDSFVELQNRWRDNVLLPAVNQDLMSLIPQTMRSDLPRPLPSQIISSGQQTPEGNRIGKHVCTPPAVTRMLLSQNSTTLKKEWPFIISYSVDEELAVTIEWAMARLKREISGDEDRLDFIFDNLAIVCADDGTYRASVVKAQRIVDKYGYLIPDRIFFAGPGWLNSNRLTMDSICPKPGQLIFNPGNPPFNEGQDTLYYRFYIQKGYNSLIHPAKWMNKAKKAKASFIAWRNWMTTSEKVKTIFLISNPFKKTDVGNQTIVVTDPDHSGPCTIETGGVVSQKGYSDEFAVRTTGYLDEFDVVVPNFDIARKIYAKVSKATCKFSSKVISGAAATGITSDLRGFIHGSSATIWKTEPYVTILVGEKKGLIFKRLLLTKLPKRGQRMLEEKTYKVVCSRSQPNVGVQNRLMLSPNSTFILSPHQLPTDSLFVLYQTTDENQAKSFFSILKTQIGRYCIYLRAQGHWKMYPDSFDWLCWDLLNDPSNLSRMWTDLDLKVHYEISDDEMYHIQRTIQSWK